VVLKLTLGLTPVPVRPTVCGLLMALSVIVSELVRLPPAVGLNVTLIVQPDAGATLAQVFVCEKSPPARAMLVKASGALPTLVSATAPGALGVPMVCEAKVRAGGARFTVGALRSKVTVGPDGVSVTAAIARSEVPSPLKSPAATSPLFEALWYE
jgi:hypothetical protein